MMPPGAQGGQPRDARGGKHIVGEISPLVTAIIPTFRRPSLLKRAVSSVLNQGFPQLVACVYDNASNDGTADVVAALSAHDSRVRYHCHSQNIGAVANFEFGLRQVTTPFFSILSDDDYLLPGFYHRAMEDLAKHPEAMFWSGLTLNVDEEGKIWDARVAQWPREGIFEPPEGVMRVTGGLCPTWTGIVFRREILETVGLPDKETLGPSDFDFILRIAAQYPFLLYKEPAAVFSLNSRSFSATQPLSSFWPGWQKMLQNMASVPKLEPADRAELLARLNADAVRMLFRRGANAIAQGRFLFARDAAAALRETYQLRSRATLLRVLSTLCESNTICHGLFRVAYGQVERAMVRSRRGLQRKYGALIARSEST